MILIIEFLKYCILKYCIASLISIIYYKRFVKCIQYPLGKAYWGKNLSSHDAYKLEKSALVNLEKKYKCTCQKPLLHFPKIIKKFDCIHTLVITNNGISVNKLRKPIIINNHEKQLDCIILNLKKVYLMHDDMHYSGKNITINKDGVISIIDFDISHFENKLSDKKLNSLKQKILNILKNNKYIILN